MRGWLVYCKKKHRPPTGVLKRILHFKKFHFKKKKRALAFLRGKKDCRIRKVK